MKMDQIEGLKQLSKGWDGEDAKKIDDQILSMVSRIVSRLKEEFIKPQLNPVQDGSVDFTWEKRVFCTLDEIGRASCRERV